MAQSLSIRFAYVRKVLSFSILCLVCTAVWAQKPALVTTKIDTLKTPIPIMGATTRRLPERVVKADSVNKVPEKASIVANPAPMSSKMVDKTAETGPLSKTAEKTPSPVVATPKAVVAPVTAAPTQAAAPVAAPVVVASTQAAATPTQASKAKVNVSPINASNFGKMGNCIEFYPNKAVISETSIACLKEMSKFLISNKNLKLNVAASLLPTEKAKDVVALKTERAKTIRNYLIQSGVEASRIAVKLTDKTEETPIVMTPQ